MTQCPCGSGDPFENCCGPCLSGNRPAPTAEALMRSRYTAFVRRLWEYLDRTHAPETWKHAGEPQESLEWLGLEVLSTEAGGEGDSEGKVEFVAHYRAGGAEGRLHEISRFVRRNGMWYYLDGKFPGCGRSSDKTPKPGRNDPCSCGSGKKYKKCCGNR